VPTVAEGGLKGFDTTDWKVLVAPAGTPADIVKRLNAEVEKAMSKPETAAQLLSEGSIPLSGSPQQAAQYLRAEQQRWSAVVREANVKLD
jgi:tripartite-type tricarboxylate transporter receptor subunit TctC